MTVQGLGPNDAREFLQPFERMLHENSLRPESVQVVLDAVGMLPEAERARWVRGHKVALMKALYETTSKSTAYYLNRLDRTALVLHEAGLIDMDNGHRDRETGRKVKSLVGELSRLDWSDDEALIRSYRNLRDQSLDVVKDAVRAHNPRVQSLDDLARDGD